MTHLRHSLSTAGLVASLLAVGFTAPALAGSHSTAETTEDTTTGEVMPEADEAIADEPAEAGDIVDVAVEAGTFNTLTAALEAAGLVDVLRGDGPFTVFAPTDEAFAALPEGVLDALLAPENQDQLVAILTYHVVPDAVLSSSLEAGEVETVEGSTVAINLDEAGVSVNEAQVVLADIEASNGVIHVIDQVLLPAEIAADLALLVTEEAPAEAAQY